MRSLIICIGLSALIHFVLLRFMPLDASPKTPKDNQKIQISWHTLPLTHEASEFLNDNTNNSKTTKDFGEKRLEWESTSAPNPSASLTKAPEMISEELLFVETDFGFKATGSITLNLTIGKNGSVKKASIIQSTARPMFEDQIMKHILKSTWLPAEKNGNTVDASITITIDIGD